jgi:hypothetical protein
MTTPNDATIASEKSEHRKQSDAEISAMHYKSDFKNLLFHVVTFYSPCAGSCLNIKGSALNALDHILAASVGGIITAFAVCPLDVVKVRLQAQIDAMSEPQGLRQFHSHLHLHFRGTLKRSSIVMLRMRCSKLPVMKEYLVYGAVYPPLF